MHSSVDDYALFESGIYDPEKNVCQSVPRFSWRLGGNFSTESPRAQRCIKVFPFTLSHLTGYSPGMFQDAYIKLDPKETESFLAACGDALEGSSFLSANSVIMKRPLAFYPGFTFYDVADHSTMPARRRFMVAKDQDIVVLDFTNAPIYALNTRAPLILNDDTLLDYVRFFFSFVRGRHGRFLICESVDDIQWREEPPPSARKAIAKMIEPLKISRKDEDGDVHVMAQMMFKDALFHTHITVAPNGNIKLSQEKMLIEDIPVLDDTLGQ